MQKTIFEISNDYLQTMMELDNFCMDNETDEVPTHIDEKLTINKEEMSEKMENYFFYIEQLNGEVATLKNHIKKMADKRKAIENKINRLKDYVGNGLEMYGDQNKSGNHFFKHDLFKVTVSRSNRLKIFDEGLLPDEYKSEVMTVKIDNTQLKSDILDGTYDGAGAKIDDSILNVNFR